MRLRVAVAEMEAPRVLLRVTVRLFEGVLAAVSEGLLVMLMVRGAVRVKEGDCVSEALPLEVRLPLPVPLGLALLLPVSLLLGVG